MSFQQNRTDISICNKALAKIKQQPLTGSLEDPANLSKLAARECVRFYKSTVARLLEQHHWGIATKRAPLIAITNPRTSEWATAYAKPSDMAFPVTLSAYGAAGNVSYYQGLGYLLASIYGRPIFRLEADTIYAQLEGAELDYVSFDITEQDFTETFEQLVVLFLAAQLADPVAKDHDLAQELENEAVIKLNTAIAHNLNAQQPRYGDTYISEAEIARGGALIDRALMGWRY